MALLAVSGVLASLSAPRVWDSSRIDPASWPSALVFYRQLEARNEDFRLLRELIEHVNGRPYAASLACATSGTALLVLPRSRLDANAKAAWVDEAVRVDVDLGGTTRLIPHDPRAASTATFATDGRVLARAFERFLEKEKWFEQNRPA